MTKRDDRHRNAGDIGLATDAAQRELQARTAQDADQTAADLDQTQADSDQIDSEADQQISDTDQTLAERDQDASDRDQAAVDSERSPASEHASARQMHDLSRVARDETRRARSATAADRATTTADRLAIANRRDEVARVRDLTATARDHAAQARDEAAKAREIAAEARERRAVEAGAPDDTIEPLRALRHSSQSLREGAAAERAAAAADRQAAATDRQYAAIHRQLDGFDELTGVLRRGTGELALTHEIERARRTSRPLVLTMIDVDELKTVNDSQGHPAGDALLRDIATTIVSTLRSYDVTVRWGGDEFLTAMSDITLAVAADRVADIQHALSTQHPQASISAGAAELHDDDNLDSLVARADSALYLNKSSPAD